METEEESQYPKINGEEKEKGGDFYEKIEAPKFVDLTAPDHYHPGDDRYWFCLRVGCDQKHEEEMDSEAIYQNFVFRVMAARSPNIQLRKVLYRKDSSASVKRPQTVPAKSSKSRISRLALISSISKRMVDNKVKIKSISKQNATPNVRAKQSSVISKALTTPRNKKQLSNPNAFQSVRNPKATTSAVPNNRVLAKALFHSPKMSARTKASIELDTTVKKLCAGIKRLELADGEKRTFGNKTLPSNASRKQLRGREVKSRVFDGLLSQNCKGKEPKSSKCVMKTNKAKNIQQYQGPAPRERAEIISDVDIEDKSGNGPSDICCATKSDEALSEASGNSQSNLKIRSSGERDAPKLQVSTKAGNDTNDGPGQIEKMNSGVDIGNGSIENNDRKHTLISDDKENDGGEAMESDDKENASASDDNRDLDLNIAHLERQIFGKQENMKTAKMITKATSNPSKESSSVASAQGLQYRKPKPTNPKPFRLRTDERGILKESNREKNLHPATSKGITSGSRFPGGNSQEKLHNTLARNGKCLEQTENANETKEDSKKERNTIQKERHQNQNSCLKTSKERGIRKLSASPLKHTVSSQQKMLVSAQQKNSEEKTALKLRSTLKRTKSPFVRKVARPQETTSLITKEALSTMIRGQLGVIKEDSPITPKEVAKPSKSSAALETKASASTASRPSLQGKRFKTIPKEQNFHTIHTPKSCTRRAA